jgi:hypothetical protein
LGRAQNGRHVDVPFRPQTPTTETRKLSIGPCPCDFSDPAGGVYMEHSLAMAVLLAGRLGGVRAAL